MRTKAIVSWSSGKDSSWALHRVRGQADIDIVGLLTTVTKEYGRVSMHGVRESLLDAQADAAGLPCHKVYIPTPCPDEVYEQGMARVLAQAKAAGVTTVVFGDLFLPDLRAYREAKLAAFGMKALFPLWGLPTAELGREMIRQGLEATLTCVDSRVLAPSFAGRRYDEALLSELPEAVDPCGERGEFHTFASAGPMFSHRIAVETGEVVDRDGFIFADVRPV